MGHFSVRAIQISFSCVVFPAILIAYFGQAAYLRKFPENVSNTFYASIPEHLYWPTFLIAVVAAVIASQAMISGAFSFISQAQSLGCFPRVKVVHTSTKHKGQVYIPEVNYMFMIACVVVTVAFKTTEKMTNAYGTNTINSLTFAYAHYEKLLGIPPIFSHFISNIPSIHSVVVFVSIKAIPIAYVALEERSLFRQVKPREKRIFCCIVRHGYRDLLGDDVEFECQLVQHLKEFICQESYMLKTEGTNADEQILALGNENDMKNTINAIDEAILVESHASSDSIQGYEVTKEIEFIEKQMENGVVLRRQTLNPTHPATLSLSSPLPAPHRLVAAAPLRQTLNPTHPATPSPPQRPLLPSSHLRDPFSRSPLPMTFFPPLTPATPFLSPLPVKRREVEIYGFVRGLSCQ
ncbi:hypothetical protein Fmac_001306 [Flemingia macrophylla]|uniref:Potassium transporter n=1 Tax=Flemingia macrophylla TaxID=520843 RepID=A0ABD1NGQ8_9FABA